MRAWIVLAACLSAAQSRIQRDKGALHLSHDAGFLRVERVCKTSRGHSDTGLPSLTLVLVAGGPGQVGTRVWRPDINALAELLRPGDCVVAYDHRGTASPTALFGHTSDAWTRNGALGRKQVELVRRTMLTQGLSRDLNMLGTCIRSHAERRRQHNHRIVAWGMSYGALVAHTASLAPDSPFDSVVLDSPSVAGRERFARDADARFWEACDASPRCSSAALALPALVSSQSAAPNACVDSIQPYGVMRTLREVAKWSPRHVPAVIDELHNCPSGPNGLARLLTAAECGHCRRSQSPPVAADGNTNLDRLSGESVETPETGHRASRKDGSTHSFAHAAVVCADLFRVGSAETAEMARACKSDPPTMSLVDGCAALHYYATTVCPPIVATGIAPNALSLEADDEHPISQVPHVLLTGGLDAVIAVPAAERFYSARTSGLLMMHVVHAQHILFPEAACLRPIIDGLRDDDWEPAFACLRAANAVPYDWA